jgi:NADH-quinone oxidoreductase subunit F
MKNHFILPERPFQNLNEFYKEKGEALVCARKLSAQDIIVELKASLLRGRGGAGFPTGLKWYTLFQDKSPKKYVVVNAAEGEPGTFKDRQIIRKNPYSMIEGALIAAHVLKCNEIYIAIKKSFVIELEILQKAIKEFKKKGHLSLVSIHLVAGPDDYLFGEEKALLNVIEGIGPFPREAHYPPYEKGLFSTATSANPALVNNVETYSRVPEIILRGAESFRSIGTENTPGPLICTLSGDVKRPGVYEVPAGIRFEDLINDYGEGPVSHHPIKAVLPGVSTGVLTRDKFEVQLDHASMESVGSGLDSCSFMVFDESRSAPRIAQEVAKFLYRESCNQCTACKTGLGISSINLDALFTDNPDGDLIERAILGAKSAPQSNRCYLPVQGSIIIPNLINTFEHEFLDLLANGRKHRPVILPFILDYLEDKNEFIFKKAVMDKDRPYEQDWESEDKNFMDRGTF